MKNNLIRRYVSTLLLAALVLCALWGIFCSTGYGQPQQPLRVEALVNGQRLTLAVAATPESRHSGLSGHATFWRMKACCSCCQGRGPFHSG